MATITVAPQTVTSKRIAALDGWRGIAILMVLEEHFLQPEHPWFGNWGGHGVTIFFVLSGYLITRNLLRESDNGGIDLRRFYIRRAFRLWPCAWAYLLFAVIFRLGTGHFFWQDALKCVFFIRNFSGNNILTEHFWSLSIEEQFYLAWPIILLLWRKRAPWIAVSGIVAVAAYRAAQWPALPIPHYFPTQDHADALLCGCLFALLGLQEASRTTLAAGFVFCFSLALLNTRVSPTAEVFAIAFAMMLTLRLPALSKVFSARPLAALGLISYSLYVWQQVFSHSITGRVTGVSVSLAVACLSYFLIEKDGIALGKRFFPDRRSIPVSSPRDERQLVAVEP